MPLTEAHYIIRVFGLVNVFTVIVNIILAHTEMKRYYSEKSHQ